MSNLWPKFTKEHPCPACGRSDWTCRAGDRLFICMRIQSERMADDGGWYHEYGNTPRPVYQPRPLPPAIDAESIASRFKTCGTDLAEQLGVTMDSLRALQAGWSDHFGAWTFPMRDGENKIIGIRLRYPGGSKISIRGSRSGLFIPQVEPQKICFCPEGPTDVAALLTMGLFAIGRPSCNSGGEMLKACLKRLNIFRVVIIADNDEIKADGRIPGIDGAKALKKQLGLPSVIWMPPSPLKDVRDFVKSGGTRQIIEADINQKVWSKI